MLHLVQSSSPHIIQSCNKFNNQTSKSIPKSQLCFWLERQFIFVTSPPLSIFLDGSSKSGFCKKIPCVVVVLVVLTCGEFSVPRILLFGCSPHKTLFLPLTKKNYIHFFFSYISYYGCFTIAFGVSRNKSSRKYSSFLKYVVKIKQEMIFLKSSPKLNYFYF